MKTYAQQLEKWRQRREKIRAYLAEGHSFSKVAAKFNITKARAFQICRKSK